MKKNYYSAYNPTKMDLLIAFNLYCSDKGEIPYSETELFDEEGNKWSTISLPTGLLNQEEIYFRKEAFDNLSDEAKEVINTVLNAPDEILSHFVTSKFGFYSRVRLMKYYQKYRKWKWKNIEKIFKEIGVYLDSIEER